MTQPIDAKTFRLAMRRVPSPVTVVTAAGADEIRGITIGSFTSVSLEPPLISFNVAHDAQIHPLLTAETDHFAIHILADDQAHLSNHFAIPDRTGADQFASVAYRRDAHGTPVLDGALAVLFCTRYAVYPAGDHSLVVGAVQRVDVAQGGSPIVYFNRGYRSVGEEVPLEAWGPVKRVSNESP